MKLFPSEEFRLLTSLSPDKVAERLNRELAPLQRIQFVWSAQNSEKLFEGYANSLSFEIRKTSGYRNIFRPVVKGFIYNEGGSSIINIAIMLPPLVSAFMIVWLSGIFLGSLYGFVISKSYPALLISFGILAVVYGTIFWGFNSGKPSTELLKKIFNAEVYSPVH